MRSKYHLNIVLQSYVTFHVRPFSGVVFYLFEVKRTALNGPNTMVTFCSDLRVNSCIIKVHVAEHGSVKTLNLRELPKNLFVDCENSF